MGSSDHCLISVSCPIVPVPPQDQPKRRCFSHYAYSDFPWKDYCFLVRNPSPYAKHITEIIVSNTFSTSKAHKPWFNLVCSRATHDRKVARKRYLSLPFPDTDALYSSARNHANSILQLAKSSFINIKSHILSNSNSPRGFWHLAKNISNNFSSSSFPLLLHPDDTPAVSSVSKPDTFTQTFADNSALEDSGLVPPSPPYSDYFMPNIQLLRNDVSHALVVLNPWKVYGPDGVLPIEEYQDTCNHNLASLSLLLFLL